MLGIWCAGGCGAHWTSLCALISRSSDGYFGNLEYSKYLHGHVTLLSPAVERFTRSAIILGPSGLPVRYGVLTV